MVSLRTPERWPFLQDRRAAAIIEFALLAPVLISVLCGLGDFGVVIFVRMLTANAAQGMADLATQSSRLQTSDVVNIYNAAYAMMKPFSSGSLVLRITSIASDGNGRAFVYWSCGHGALAPLAARSTQTSSATNSAISNVYLLLYNQSNGGYYLYGTNTTYITVEALNTFSAPSQYVIKGNQTMSVVAYTLPRLSTYVGFPWNGVPANYPPSPTSATRTASTTIAASGTTVTCNYSY